MKDRLTWEWFWKQLLLCCICFSISGVIASDKKKEPMYFSVSDKQLAEKLELWTKNSADFVENRKSGLIPAATQFPQVARVYVKYKKDGVSGSASCSGVLIKRRQVLTAGHCVCGPDSTASWYFSDYQKCSKNLQNLSVEVFLPASGIISTVGKPLLHPAYRSPQKSPYGPETPVRADLAILNLDMDVPVTPAIISSPILGERPILASYGRLQFASIDKNPVFKSGIPYQDGVRQLSYQKPLLGYKKDCGSAASSDSFCTEYNEYVFTTGPQMDAGACKGDSGAPLFLALNNKEKTALIGLASYVDTVNESPYDCKGSRLTFFTHLAKYKNWLEQQSANISEQVKLKSECKEAIFQGPRNVEFNSPQGVLSITAFDEIGKQTPAVELVDVPLNQCRALGDSSLTSCLFNIGSKLKIKFGVGIFQLTICSSS